MAKGAKEEVFFPVLAVFASNIDDVEIVSSEIGMGKLSKKANYSGNSSTKAANSNASKSNYNNTNNATKPNNNTSEPTYQSPHATPSVYANKTHTFPTGNARQSLPASEFDFAANLARFDKANEFKKIQADDSIPKADRLVSINSPQRKLGIRESVLDPKDTKNTANTSTSSVNSASSVNASTSTANTVNTVNSKVSATTTSSTNNVTRSTSPKGVTDEIMEKFKHLTVLKSKSSPLLVEDGSTSEDEPCDRNNITGTTVAAGTTAAADMGPTIPMISSEKYEKYCLENPNQLESFRSTGSLNFAHHLLADLDPSKTIVLLLGVGESSAILMETFYHLCNHSRLKGQEIYAIFAAGAAGSSGKRIELTSAVKNGRKKLLNLEKIKFTTSLSDILKLPTGAVTVFDALGHDGEMTENAVKGLTDWMKKVKTVYGIESSLLRNTCKGDLINPIKLVTFGIARDTISPSLQSSKSILYVDTGISFKILKEEFASSSAAAAAADATSDVADFGTEIYSESFVTELEY